MPEENDSKMLGLLSEPISLQRDLINTLVSLKEEDLTTEDDLLDRLSLRIVDNIQRLLDADASSIWYATDDCTATMSVGAGYQRQFARYSIKDEAIENEQKEPASSPIWKNDDPRWEKSESLAKKDKIGVTGYIISKSQGLLFPNARYRHITEHPWHRGKYDNSQRTYSELEVKSFVGVPVRNRDNEETFGLIKCERVMDSGKDIFDLQDQSILESLAHIAARCRKLCARVFKTTVHEQRISSIRRESTNWTNELLSEAFHVGDDMENYLNTACEIIQSALKADSCAVFLFDKVPHAYIKTMTQQGGSGYQRLQKVVRSYVVPPFYVNESCRYRPVCEPHAECKKKDKVDCIGLTAWIAVNEKPFFAPNRKCLLDHCEHKGAFDKENACVCGGFIGYPLMIAGTVTGVVKVEKNADDPNSSFDLFDCSDFRQVGIYARELSYIISKIAVIHENRLDEYEKKYNKDILFAGLNVKELVEKTIKVTQELFTARACALFLRVGSKLIQPEWAAIGWNPRFRETHSYSLVPEEDILDNPLEESSIRRIPEKRYVQYVSQSNFRTQKENQIAREIRSKYQKSHDTYGNTIYELQLSEDLSESEKKACMRELQDNLRSLNFGSVGLTVWLAVKKERFVAKSNAHLKSHPHHRGTFDADNFTGTDKCESFMGISLLDDNNELLGVLKVETKMKHAREDKPKEFVFFTEQDEFMFSLIAKNVALGIQNARKFEAEVLYRSILQKKGNGEIFRLLNDFIKGRQSENEQVIKVQSNLSPHVADLVTAFSALMQRDTVYPDDLVPIMNSFSESEDKIMRDAFDALKRSLAVSTVEEMLAISPDSTMISSIFTAQFDKYNTPNVLSDTLREMREILKEYIANPHLKVLVGQALNVVAKHRAKINYLSFGIEGRILESILDLFRYVFEESNSRYVNVVSPYIAGMALEAGSEIFFGREEIFRKIETNVISKFAIITGQGRIGKSSLINQLNSPAWFDRMKKTTGKNACTVHINLLDWDSDLVHVAMYKFAKKMHAQLPIMFNVSAPSDVEFTADWVEAFCDYWKVLIAAIPESNFVIFSFDEYEKFFAQGDNSRTRFVEKLRPLVDSVTNALILFVGRTIAKHIPLPFFSTVSSYGTSISIGFLDTQAAKDLLERPLKKYGVTYEEGAIEHILEQTGCHPGYIQHICQKCVDSLNVKASGYQIDRSVVDSALESAIFDCPFFPDEYRDLFHRLSLLFTESPHSQGSIVEETAVSIMMHVASAEPSIHVSELKERVKGTCDECWTVAQRIILYLIEREILYEVDGVISFRVPLFRDYVRAEHTNSLFVAKHTRVRTQR